MSFGPKSSKVHICENTPTYHTKNLLGIPPPIFWYNIKMLFRYCTHIHSFQYYFQSVPKYIYRRDNSEIGHWP